MIDKRLTEAEMAAEFHRAIYFFMGSADLHSLFNDAKTEADLDRDTGWMYAMERIGIAPHAHENNYE